MVKYIESPLPPEEAFTVFSETFMQCWAEEPHEFMRYRLCQMIDNGFPIWLYLALSFRENEPNIMLNIIYQPPKRELWFW